MMVKYDYSSDVVTVDGVDYPLSDYRRWLLLNHSQLCSGHFIKAIKIKDKTVFTYDWQSIYLRAEEYEFLNDFIHDTRTN